MLLQPMHVLPEFLMHVRYHRQPQPQGEAAGEGAAVTFGPFSATSGSHQGLPSSTMAVHHPIPTAAAPGGVVSSVCEVLNRNEVWTHQYRGRLGVNATQEGWSSPGKRGLASGTGDVDIWDNSVPSGALSPTPDGSSKSPYTSGTNAQVIAHSLAIGKRKQELCNAIGHTIVRSIESIKSVY